MAKITFAAGCFWGIEYYFSQLEGVKGTTVGYIGGTEPKPTYEKVCTGSTGHAEAVEIIYDPSVISFEQLLEHFYTCHDATLLGRQTQYQSAIYCDTPEQLAIALDYKEALTATKKYKTPIITQVITAPTFYPAEEYHQQYFKKQGLKSCPLPFQKNE